MRGEVEIIAKYGKVLRLAASLVDGLSVKRNMIREEFES